MDLGCTIYYDDQISLGHLLASLSTIKGDVLWDIDIPQFGYSEDVKAHKNTFEEERAAGFLYLASIFFQFQHERGNLTRFFEWFFKIADDLFDNDFSVFAETATKVCMAVHGGGWPSWFDTFCTVAGLPEFVEDGRVRLQHYEEWPYWSYVIISSHYWQTDEIIPQDIEIPQEKDIFNILDMLEEKPEAWHEVLGKKTLHNFRNNIEKTIKQRKSNIQETESTDIKKTKRPRKKKLGQ